MILPDEETTFILCVTFYDGYEYYDRYYEYDNTKLALSALEIYKTDREYKYHQLYIAEEITDNKERIKLYENLK